MQTVVGLFQSVSEASQARQALLNQGCNGGDVTVIDQSESDYTAGSYGSSYDNTATGSGVTGVTGSNTGITDPNTAHEYGGTATATDTGDTGVGAKIKHFFQGLTGHDEHTHRAYTEGVSRGGALVAVNVDEGEVNRATTVLRQYGATEIEGSGNGAGYESSVSSATSDYNSADRTDTADIRGEQVIPVVEEELVVGKREVQRGGVRVYSRVVTEPVSEQVSLHDERIVVDRRTVDRPATDADFANAGPIEVRATGEEAVVGKTGRVVEEVVVGKAANDRTETVQDTVRHTEVDVQPVSTDDTTTSGGTRNTTGNRY